MASDESSSDGFEEDEELDGGNDTFAFMAGQTGTDNLNDDDLELLPDADLVCFKI